MKQRLRRTRGVTLVELLMSLVVIVVGMLAIFRVIGTSVTATSTSSRVAQAQQRAVDIVEAIRTAPSAALTCLLNTPQPALWGGCETICQNNQTAGAAASGSSCIFTPNGFSKVNGPTTGLVLGAGVTNQSFDRLGQRYFFNTNVPTPTGATASYGATYVRQTGPLNRVVEIAVSIAWNDDNSTPPGPAIPDHSVTMISGVFQ